MDIEFVRQRITELRLKRDISEYQLSYDLGHSKNYIHNIVAGHSHPSVKELLYLIELKEMPDGDLEAVLLMIRRLNDKSS